jgi:tRNA nucleotidyltransferase (CCA-adding enzyme)
MKLGKTASAIRLMKATNLLGYILPEIHGLVGVKHDKRSHQEGDVYKHTLLVLSNAPPTIEGQLAALLHDVGKPDTQEFIGNKIQFLGHEDVGAEMAEAILRRLKFDNKTIQKVKTMVKNHMRPHSLEKASPKALRKFVRDVGEEMVDNVLDLAEADSLGNLPPRNYIPELRKRIEETKKIPVARKPVLSGHEIMELLNEKPGPIIGQVGNYLLDLQDELAEEGEELTREKAKEMVRKRFASLSKRMI